MILELMAKITPLQVVSSSVNCKVSGEIYEKKVLTIFTNKNYHNIFKNFAKQ